MTAAPVAATPRRARLLRRVGFHRTARGARAEVALRPGVNAERVHGQLMRRGRTIAVASRAVREHRAVLRFRDAPDLPAGTYTLLLTVVDDAGLIATRRRRVTLA